MTSDSKTTNHLQYIIKKGMSKWQLPAVANICVFILLHIILVMSVYSTVFEQIINSIGVQQLTDEKKNQSTVRMQKHKSTGKQRKQKNASNKKVNNKGQIDKIN